MNAWSSATVWLSGKGSLPSWSRRVNRSTFPGSIDVLRISSESEGFFTLRVLCTPNVGQPERRPIPKAVNVGSGQYVRIKLNARHATYSGQYYSETVYNVASGEELASNRFSLGPPDHDLDLKANLF